MVESTDESELILDLEDYFAPDKYYVNLEMPFSNVLIDGKYFKSWPDNWTWPR